MNPIQGDLSQEQEQDVLRMMAKITAIPDLATLLKVVVEQLPVVVGALGCGIYLLPEFVPEYHNVLLRDKKEFGQSEVEQDLDDFIVLAATNRIERRSFLGKAFFCSGEGITGWVFKNKRSVIIDDVRDQNELFQISPDLSWSNHYQDADNFYGPDDKRRLLAVPLVISENPIGVLKFHATRSKEPFQPIVREIAEIVAQIISGVIRQAWVINQQGHAISNLIEITVRSRPLEVISSVTISMKEMMNCYQVQFLQAGKDGSLLHLRVENGRILKGDGYKRYKPGEGLKGWIYKTGRPLLLPDIKQFSKGIVLDKDILSRISDGEEISEDDKYLKCDEDIPYYTNSGRLQIVSFIGVPVVSPDYQVLGVLCGYWNNTNKPDVPYTRSQLILAQSFASTIALSLENERQRALNELLTNLGYLSSPTQLFETVKEKIPQLVTSSGCSIFVNKARQGESVLRLMHTSRKILLEPNGKPVVIEYKLGEGKTGMCGLTRESLIVNHFGSGSIIEKKIMAEEERIKRDKPQDSVNILFDEKKQTVGVMHLHNGKHLASTTRMLYKKIVHETVFNSNGLLSAKMDPYLSGISQTWSFAAIPISTDHNLLGVITLARPLASMAFSVSDIDLVRSVAGRLATVMGNLHMQEQRKRLVMSLAHEINTPLTGILADSQNLYEELPEDGELREIARHNLEQVLRLHMQTSTIMTVLSEQSPARQFSEHNIYRPLMEAKELFATEAAIKRCDIVGPRALDGNFPVIEMSLFDLTIALKNIIHNAVKYSFYPSIKFEKQRYVKIWGKWANDKKNYTVSIQNYGVGIKESEIRRIFDPYYRGELASDRKRTGAGFGLAHARQVIEEMHHGSIKVTSEPQGGDAYLTTFIVTLPIRQSQSSNMEAGND